MCSRSKSLSENSPPSIAFGFTLSFLLSVACIMGADEREIERRRFSFPIMTSTGWAWSRELGAADIKVESSDCQLNCMVLQYRGEND